MCLFFISSCSDYQDTTRWLPYPSSIKGTLGYTANPFNSKDSVLCVNDIYRVEVQCNTKEYYTYLKKIFSNYEGVLDNGDAALHDSSAWIDSTHFLFYPKSKIIAFPKKDESFISIVDKGSGSLLNSITYKTTYNLDTLIVNRSTSIYLKAREEEDKDYSNSIYLGDIISFDSFNNSDTFITDSITPNKEQIICFEASYSISHVQNYPQINNRDNEKESVY